MQQRTGMADTEWRACGPADRRGCRGERARPFLEWCRRLCSWRISRWERATTPRRGSKRWSTRCPTCAPTEIAVRLAANNYRTKNERGTSKTSAAIPYLLRKKVEIPHRWKALREPALPRLDRCSDSRRDWFQCVASPLSLSSSV